MAYPPLSPGSGRRRDRLNRVGCLPGLEAAFEGHRFEAPAEKLVRHTGAGLFAGSSAERDHQPSAVRLGRLPEGDRDVVDTVTAQIVNKLLHLPTVRMKEAAVTPDGVLYADVVRHLFGLGEESET